MDEDVVEFDTPTTWKVEQLEDEEDVAICYARMHVSLDELVEFLPVCGLNLNQIIDIYAFETSRFD